MTHSNHDPQSQDDPSAPRQPQSVEHATNRHVLSLLVCPLTRAPLRYDSQAQELISPAAGLAYPIWDGVPIMTEGAARPLTELEIGALKASGSSDR
jgi:uncharacterized protein